jgi:hypothetical protein
MVVSDYAPSAGMRLPGSPTVPVASQPKADELSLLSTRVGSAWFWNGSPKFVPAGRRDQRPGRSRYPELAPSSLFHTIAPELSWAIKLALLLVFGG